MSWMKQPQGAPAPPRGPDRQSYAAPQAQGFGNQQGMYPNYQGTSGNTQQQQYWQTPPPQQAQYNQQFGQVHQQDYPANANPLYHQPAQYNQNYNNYSNPHQEYQQNVYPNQPVQQNYTQKANTETWEDNWDWGWDEASKQAHKAQSMLQQQQVPQHQVFNNANVIEESFATTDSWNWAVEDKKEIKQPIPSKVESTEPVPLPVSHPVVENSTAPNPSTHSSDTSGTQQAEEVKMLGDRDAVKERLPNLALGKRFNLDNLTPQWSIESQMSQESSDGLHTHSEGTYRSDNQSRNSSKGSPGLNTDNSNFNYSQPGTDEYPQNSEWSRSDELTLTDVSSQHGSHDMLSNSMQEMNLGNHENPTIETLQESRIKQESMLVMQPPHPISLANQPPPVSASHQPQFQPNLQLQPGVPVNLPPPPSSAIPRPSSSSGSLPRPPSSSGSLPRPPSASGMLPPHPPPSSTATMPPPPVSASLPPPPASSATIPPTNFPASSTNPFKHAGPFSHKTTVKSAPMQFPPHVPNSNSASSVVVNKVSQHRGPMGFEANLETTPDNSERPDQPQMSAFRPVPVSQQIPDNMEVAPRNDRNEYLQTAHLSSSEYGENTDFSHIPPPGLRRMVVGQQESEYGQNLNMSGDEPPPGLARMVPGQQTEAENAYNQLSDDYMDRHIDGQLTDNSGRPYRQADGQQTPDNYTQPTSRGNERRPIGLDRMVPGEPSNDEYSQYQGSNYVSNEQRVVTGVDHDFTMSIDAVPSDVREQNVDGSDYSEQTPRNPPRNIIGARESIDDVSPDFGATPEEQQREVIMEGENLQDLSIISSAELTYSREQIMDGADVTITDAGNDRKTDASDLIEHPVTSSRRQSLNCINRSEEDSERDRMFKSSPRRDRDKHKSSRDRDKDRDRVRDTEGRYSRGDRKYDRDDRRSGRNERRSEKDRKDRDRQRERVESPDARRHRRSTRSRRYETEDTDYYSDKEKDSRRYREGSYTSSKPPRLDDKDRRYGEERDRSKRYYTVERGRRYDEDWEGEGRVRRGDRHRETYERRYRDIDPTRKQGNLRREREDERRRGDTYSSPSRPDSREATATDEDVNESRRRSRRHPRQDPYYDGYGGDAYSDPYALQRQQYQYYEHLRLTDPAAYMLVYKQVLAGQPPPPPPPHYHHKMHHLYGEGYSSLGYDGRAEERGSVHSGRSSTAGLKGNETYYLGRRHEGVAAADSLRDAPSLRTDISDRELTTDASLNLHLEESTVRSERMTPFRFSTAHIKGSISSRHVVVVRPSYPVDGRPATVQLMSLAAALDRDPLVAELHAYPGPLVKGVTHKKSVIEYCGARARGAAREAGAARDVIGYGLLWELLALLLRQNGVVVGSDIAEVLMKNTHEYEYKSTSNKPAAHNESRRESSLSGEMREEEARSSSPDLASISTSDITHQESPSSPGQTATDAKAALDKLRDFLIYGNRHEAIEWAMSNNLWGHALQLAAHGDRRTRAAVAARFLQALPRTDPLHTLYATLAANSPPAATCVSDERWGDWRPHAAIILANTSARPDQDRRTLTQLGDSLSTRGLIYSAQFCYLSAGVEFGAHPLAPLPPPHRARPTPAPAAPPRLSLLLAEPKANTLQQLATNKAIFATEIYEYAMSLSQQDYVIDELQVYKLVVACRLVDAGMYERALAYTEQAARAVTRTPQNYSPVLVNNLANLADRLKYHDPALQEEGALPEEPDSGDPSPRHHQQWLHDVKNVAHMLTAGSASQQATPQHQHDAYYTQQQQQQQYGWGEQAQQYQQPVQTYAEPAVDAADYAAQYYNPQPQPAAEPVAQSVGQQEADPQPYTAYGDDWQRTEEHHAQSYADPYWQGDSSYGYGEAGGGAGGGTGEEPAGAEQPRPTITMPGTAAARPPLYGDYDDDRPPSADQNDRETDSPKSSNKKPEAKSKGEQSKGEGGAGRGGGWLGGILTKLSLRPPNQMILPDDKNPTIVWDEDKKRWRNLDGDTDESARPPPPPPKITDLAPTLRSSSPPLQAASMAPPAAGMPPAPPVSNIFKMQKGRHIKKSYVDVFNPSGAATRPLPPAAEVLGPAPPTAPTANYFVPAPTNQITHVSIPPTPSPTPPPIPDSPTSFESGIYDPTQMGNDDDQYRSGI